MDFNKLRSKLAAERQAPAPAPRPAAAPAPRPAATPAARPAAPRPLGNVPAAAPITRRPAAPAQPARPAVQARPFGGPARPQPQRQVGSFFAGIRQARELVDANYDREGSYLARIDSVRLKPTRERGTCLFIEKTVVHAIDDANGFGHKIGETSTHMLSTSGKQANYFLPEMKAFMACAFECDADEIDESDCDKVVSDAQPLAGMVVEWRGRAISLNALDKSGQPKPFTKVKYIRRVHAGELLGILDEQAWAAFFPNGQLEAEAAEEAQGDNAPAQDGPAPENAPAAQVYDDGQGGLCLEDGTPCDEQGNAIQ